VMVVDDQQQVRTLVPGSLDDQNSH
jgi:hypothetical protein